MNKLSAITKQIFGIPSYLKQYMIDFPLRSMKTMQRQKIKLQELQSVHDKFDNANHLYEKFQQFRAAKSKCSPVRIISQFLYQQLWELIYVVIILSVVASLLHSYRPMVIKNLVDYLEGNTSQSLMICIGIFLMLEIMEGLISEIRWSKNNFMHLNMHNKVKSIIYQKILRLSSGTKGYLQTGTIVSHYHSDTGAIGGFLHHSVMVFSAPIKLIISCYYLIAQIGYLGLLGPILSILSIYIRVRSQKMITKFAKKKDAINDKLSKLINEYVSGIRVIKYYGWENIVTRKIVTERNKKFTIDIDREKMESYSNQASGLIFNLYTFSIVAISWLLYGNVPTLGSYMIISMLNGGINQAMNQLNQGYKAYNRVKISATKIYNFLQCEEKQSFIQKQGIQQGQIQIQNAKFSWFSEVADLQQLERQKYINDEDDEKENKEKKQQKKINNVVALEIQNLSVQAGELVGVVGSVGCGKSTLLSSILGQTKKLDGVVKSLGSTSYCPQTPWLRNQSIRNNILFEGEYNKQRYKLILQISQLQVDLKNLENGDQTVIGQKGIKLSGGQKQRISLARCLYSNSSINIIDDCLSALDAGIGKKIFHECIISYLKNQGKTVVMTLNALEYLQYFDKVVYIEKGKVCSIGSFNEVKQRYPQFFSCFKQDQNSSKKQKSVESDQQFSELSIRNSSSTKQEGDDNQSVQQLSKDIQKPTKAPQKQIQKNTDQSLRLLLKYITLGSSLKQLWIPFLFFALHILGYLEQIWIGSFSKQNSSPFNFFMILFSFLIVRIVLSVVKGITIKKLLNKKSGKLGEDYLKVIFKATMGWFDSKPVGQILERGINYQNRMQNQMVYLVHSFLDLSCQIVVKLTLFTLIIPSNIIVIFISMLIMTKYNNKFSSFQKKIAKLSNDQGQKFSNLLQQTVTGIYVIRAFHKQAIFYKKYDIFHIQLVNMHSNWHHVMGSLKSLIRRITSIFITALMTFMILQTNQNSKHEQNNSVYYSMFLSIGLIEVIQITNFMSGIFDRLNWLNRLIQCFDKIISWIENCPSEKSFVEPAPSSQNWVFDGKCQISDVSYRYKDTLPLVLKNISLSVQKGQKIGVVGRTGSGKSTMTLGLLRILQISENEDNSKGSIRIDGTNISQIGLHHLRHSVAMIPQDPLLFSGTIKSNIDPLQTSDNQRIAQCLKKIGIWDDIKSNEDEKDETLRKLLGKVQQNGQNYSLGQRQLICLARALVRNPKLLIMDEATASIDLQTDSLVQKLINQEFKQTTVITIAHRLNTIINYDKILTLQNGNFVEFDSPLKLLLNPQSNLGRSVRQVGEQYTKKMISLAMGQQNEQ